MMTPQELRLVLRGDRSMALQRLRGRPLEDWQQALDTERARRRPRKLLIHSLEASIHRCGEWQATIARINAQLAQRPNSGNSASMAWQDAKEKAQQLYTELLKDHDHGYCGMVLDAMQRLHTRSKPKAPKPHGNTSQESQQTRR